MKVLAPFLAAVMLAPATGFSFAHQWKIQEIYSNADGSVQFVEFFTPIGNDGETLMNNQTIKFDINLVTQKTMTFSLATATDGTANLDSATGGKTVLIGTSTLTTLYGLTPDYTLPANFLSAGSLNTIIFSASTDRVNLTNLPTNGVMSLDGLVNNPGSTAAETAINSVATPKNFAGQSVTIPEPGTVGCIVFGAVALGAVSFFRRRSS